MPYDFENREYSPIRDVEERARIRKERGIKEEWFVRICARTVRVCSHTHDDDVELVLTGNFDDNQGVKVAFEICAQLNKAELEAAKEFDNEI